MKVPKTIYAVMLALCTITASSLTANAGCVTHIMKDENIPSNWDFESRVRTIYAGSHLYPSELDSQNNPIHWDTCNITIYVNRYSISCRNCSYKMKYKEASTDPIHSVSH